METKTPTTTNYGAVLVSKDNRILVIYNQCSEQWGVINGTCESTPSAGYIRDAIRRKTSINLGTLPLKGHFPTVLLNKKHTDYNIKLNGKHKTYRWVPLDQMINNIENVPLNQASRDILHKFIQELEVRNQKIQKYIDNMDRQKMLPNDTFYSYGGVIESRDQYVLIVLQAASGLWGIPKGKKKDGETRVACIQREIAEEVGLSITLPSDAAIHENIYTIVRLRKPAQHYSITIQEEEIQEYRWIPLVQLDDILRTMAFNRISHMALSHYFNQVGGVFL